MNLIRLKTWNHAGGEGRLYTRILRIGRPGNSIAFIRSNVPQGYKVAFQCNGRIWGIDNAATQGGG